MKDCPTPAKQEPRSLLNDDNILAFAGVVTFVVSIIAINYIIDLSATTKGKGYGEAVLFAGALIVTYLTCLLTALLMIGAGLMSSQRRKLIPFTLLYLMLGAIQLHQYLKVHW